MKFVLEGFLEANTSLEKYKDYIGQLIEEANKTILVKGIPKGVQPTKVVDWKVEDRFIKVKIVGTRYLRPHAAIKRLQRFFQERLGRERIGIRKVFCERYVIEIPKPVERVSLLKYYDKVSEIEEKDDYVKITLVNLDEREIERGDVDRLIRFVSPTVRTIQRELADKVGTVIAQSEIKKIYFNEDPAIVGEKLGWVVRFPGKAQWIYLPPFTALQKAIASIIFDYVSKPLGFIEVLFPKLIPIEIAFRAKKLQGEPGGMYYVCTPRYREKERYYPFQVKAEITNELPMKELKELLEDPMYILDPIQCFPFYQLYRNKVLRKEDLPIKVVEAGGPTYRYEAGGSRGLERVDEFWRIEHVWLGLPQQCIEIRKQVMEKMIYVVDKVLDLEWRIEFAGDTFFLAEDQKIEEDIEIPPDPKYELKIYLPFKGPRESKERDVWLACASFNLAGNHYTKNFNIKCSTGETLWTGCFGVGLTRLTTAFLAQKGFDPVNWPEEVKKRCGDISKLKLPGIGQS